jgi:8-oxo-dGTP pyrophosphatase MutT (NUDIX family)
MLAAMQTARASLAPTLSEARFRALAGRVLHKEPPGAPGSYSESTDADFRAAGGPSDFDLNPELLPELARHPAPRAAAVLVPIVARPNLTVLFTQRTDHLPSHAGQISFPGGKMEDGDSDPLATALREAREEIGLSPSFVEPLGFLDPYRTGTGFRIAPVVAIVQPGFTLTLDPNEVADAFEVPLGFLMDASNHKTHVRTWRGSERRYYAMPFEQRYIWGATAGIMKNLYERLQSA